MFLRVLSVALVLVSVLNVKADPQAIVYGPREFLDSGQTDREISSPFLTVYGSRKFLFGNRNQEFSDSSEEEDEDYTSYEEEDYEDYEDYEDDDEVEDYWRSFLDSEEESNEYNRPLSRVRRRIIPVGKALDRDRAGERNPYGRGRSPWAEAPIKRDSVVQKGPTGSDALFTLYPDLAPPAWREAHGFTNTKKKAPKVTEVVVPKTKPKRSKHKVRETRFPPKVVNNSKSYSKRKVKLSKDMREEVAAYALIHGVEDASVHFSKKYRTPIKTVAVEKYLRRYSSRKEKKGDKN